MASDKSGNQYLRTFVLGILSISSYVFLYTHQEWVIDHFTRGGWYALFPIGTAFYFSFVHGAFTSGLLHVIGFRVAAKNPGTAKPAAASAKGE